MSVCSFFRGLVREGAGESTQLLLSRRLVRSHVAARNRLSEIPMLWILSSLRAFHGFARAHTTRALLPLLLFFAAALSGAACRDDDGDALGGKDAERDDSDASPIAGAVQGAFSVSSTGEATYSIPLILPPGAAGMAPSLGVAYSSASGEGMLGRGFSLSGLSAITRCARSMAQDGEI